MYVYVHSERLSHEQTNILQMPSQGLHRGQLQLSRLLKDSFSAAEDGDFSFFISHMTSLIEKHQDSEVAQLIKASPSLANRV